MGKFRTPSFSRREFLRQGALTAGTVLLGPCRCATARTAAPQPIIDSHVHFYDPFRDGGIVWPPRDNAVLYTPHLPAQFRALTEGLGIVGVVAIEAEARPEDNQWVLDLAKTEPLIVGYIGRLSPGQPDFAANFDHYVKNPVFRGLRLRADMLAKGLGGKAFDKDVQRVAEHRLALDLVGGPEILPDVPRLAKIAPGVRLVMDHLPFPEWDHDPTAMRRALEPIAALPNVFAKISTVLRRVDGDLVTDPHYYRAGLDVLWELFGEDRVIYGSNWPVSDMTAPYDSVLEVVADYVNGKGPAAAAKFFWKNSLAAYQWQPRGAAIGLRAK